MPVCYGSQTKDTGPKSQCVSNGVGCCTGFEFKSDWESRYSDDSMGLDAWCASWMGYDLGTGYHNYGAVDWKAQC
jgi:hypothetical protein